MKRLPQTGETIRGIRNPRRPEIATPYQGVVDYITPTLSGKIIIVLTDGSLVSSDLFHDTWEVVRSADAVRDLPTTSRSHAAYTTPGGATR